MLAAQSLAAPAQLPLHLSAGDNGVRIYEPDAPVQGLRTFRQAVLGSLILSQDSYNLKGGLLEKFYWDYDKKRYVLILKDGLKFHNGRPVTAQDLEFSLVRGLFTKKATWFKSFLTNIDGVESASRQSKYKPGIVKGIKVVGARTVEVKLSSPNPSFLHSLTMPILSLVPKEELNADLLTWKKHPVGAGPYKIISVDKNSNEVLVEKVNASATGPTQVLFSTNGIDSKTDIAILNAPDTRHMASETLNKATSVTGIYFNYENPLGRDKNFRSAIKYLISRSSLTKDVNEYKPIKQLLASHHWGRIKIGDTHSLKKAQAYLKKVTVDLPDIIKVPVFNSNFGKGIYGDYVNALTKQFSAVGINIEFFDSTKKFFDEDDKKHPMRIMSLGADLVDPLVLFTLFSKGSLLKYHHPVSDKKFNKLLNQAKQEDSLSKRAESVAKLSQHFFDENYAIPLFERKPVIFFDDKRVSTIGKQDGGLTFYLDKVRLK